MSQAFRPSKSAAVFKLHDRFVGAQLPSPSPPPAQGGIEAVSYPSWRKARDHALAALLAGQKRLILTGPPGTGKTLLLRDLVKVLGSAGWDAVLHSANAGALPARGSAGLPATASRVVLVDEAERLDADQLHALLGAGEQHALVLAGLDSLAERCPGNARLRLAPMAMPECGVFVSLWLAQVGHDAAKLSDAAVARVAELSQGIPRVLGILLNAAIWLTESAGAAQVSVADVEEAAAMRNCVGEQELAPAAPPAAVGQSDQARSRDAGVTPRHDPVLVPRHDHAVVPGRDPVATPKRDPVAIPRHNSVVVPTVANAGALRLSSVPADQIVTRSLAPAKPVEVNWAVRRGGRRGALVLAATAVGCIGLGVALGLHPSIPPVRSNDAPGAVARPPPAQPASLAPELHGAGVTVASLAPVAVMEKAGDQPASPAPAAASFIPSAAADNAAGSPAAGIPPSDAVMMNQPAPALSLASPNDAPAAAPAVGGGEQDLVRPNHQDAAAEPSQSGSAVPVSALRLPAAVEERPLQLDLPVSAPPPASAVIAASSAVAQEPETAPKPVFSPVPPAGPASSAVAVANDGDLPATLPHALPAVADIAPPPVAPPPVVAPTVIAQPVQVASLPSSQGASAHALSPASAATLELLLRRGDQLFALGDVSGARLLYGRAASSGSALASSAMGRTYDPAVLADLGAGIAPNPSTAAEWYRRAIALGSSEAAEFLARLEAR